MFRWSLVWMSLSAACEAANLGIRQWYLQKAIATIRTLPDPRGANATKALSIFNKALDEAFGVQQIFMVGVLVTALFFVVCFVRWLLAIRTRRKHDWSPERAE